MNDPRQPQSVPLPPIPQRPAPQGPQPVRPIQHVPQAPHAPHMPQQAPRPPMAPHAQPTLRPQPPAQTLTSPRPAPALINPHAGDAPLELDPIEMDDESAEEIAPAAPGTKIKFGADGMMKKHAWKRATTATGHGACRVRTFHGKLSDQGLEYLDEAINTFLDEHPEIEIKFVTSNVGMFDGKFKDLALIVNVWY